MLLPARHKFEDASGGQVRHCSLCGPSTLRTLTASLHPTRSFASVSPHQRLATRVMAAAPMAPSATWHPASGASCATCSRASGCWTNKSHRDMLATLRLIVVGRRWYDTIDCERELSEKLTSCASVASGPWHRAAQALSSGKTKRSGSPELDLSRHQQQAPRSSTWLSFDGLQVDSRGGCGTCRLYRTGTCTVR